MSRVRNGLSWLVAGCLWLLHFLPMGVLSRVGRALGGILYRFGKQRRHVARTNIGLCFPELSAEEREALVLEHFKLLGRSLIERGLFWWGSPERLDRLVRASNAHRVRELLDAGKPVILLAPHFLGLDAGGVAVSRRFDVISLYATQSNPVFDRLLYRGRRRFGDQLLLSRQDGTRATVKAMRAGRPFYYLPDLNARRRDAVFAPFFGIPAATVSGLPRLARLAGATIVPCLTRLLPGGLGYEVSFEEAWTDYPSEDPDADTARMNAWIEAAVRTMPAQYYWVHRRFKTRPQGEARIY
ncbi:MAG: lysophospholipid acyltransferase family protein [Dechloromonas sp.]|nr:lysophospholipid acyltransferase family protein [Dechloromonas sp.]